MTAAAVLADLQAAGVRAYRVDANTVRLIPKAAVTPEILAKVRAAKPMSTTLADFEAALAHVGEVLEENEPRHRSHWRTQPVAEHVRHAVLHLHAFEAGDVTENHLAHAAPRCLMALELALRGAR